MAVFAVISNPSIDAVLRDPRIWRGTTNDCEVAYVASGHAALDAALPHRGWTQGAVTEILFDLDGIGELDLVLPALARLTQQRRHVVLVAPPYLPYAPALFAYGVDLGFLHCVETSSDVEALWAAEQCLRSGVCAAVLCWPRQASDRTLRRLQVAAEFGNALGFAFRNARAETNPSPAATRIRLHADEGTRLRILKCRGANPPARMILLRPTSQVGQDAMPFHSVHTERSRAAKSKCHAGNGFDPGSSPGQAPSPTALRSARTEQSVDR